MAKSQFMEMLPKQIAGLQLSKRAPTRGMKMLALLRHPIVAPLALAAVTAGIAAFKDARVRAAAERARVKAGEKAAELKHGAAVVGSAVGSAIAEKAAEGKRRIGEAYRNASEAYDAAHTFGTTNGDATPPPTRRIPAKEGLKTGVATQH